MVVDMPKLKKENYREYRKMYRNEKLKSLEWYCDVCNNGKITQQEENLCI